MKNSEVVLSLSRLASIGKYEVTPKQAREMNALFVEVARVINEMEAQEKQNDDNS